MTTFNIQLQQYIELINAELERPFCTRILHPYQPVLDAMKYSLLSGGKRIRGVMVLAFYHLFEKEVISVLPFAAAIEMIHAYSLIHDDLPCMDDDDLRRGVPACHIAFGEATALLAGDALLTLAFDTVANCKAFPAERVQEVAAMLAGAAGAHGMIGGQVMDLAGAGRVLTAEELDAINDRKTGALFAVSAAAGCILAGHSEAQSAAGAYTAHVARAFQIMDDILDVTADPGKLGKPVGSDAGNNKNTYAALHGTVRCRERIQEHTAAAKEVISKLLGDTTFLAQLAAYLGGRDF